MELNRKLIVGISSRALFDLDSSHQIYEEQGLETYRHYQRTHEQVPLKPGFAYPLVEKFLALNGDRSVNDCLVEVLLLSRNTADTGLRIFNSIKHYGLNVTRAAFTGGKSPYAYAKAFHVDLFLSLNSEDVQNALACGLAAANIWSGPGAYLDNDSLNIAFDGDAVLFSDESERVYKTKGLDAFNENEVLNKDKPLADGPFRGFIHALHNLQQQANLPIPIRTALVTARSAPSHERVIQTLRNWDIRLDETVFLGGLEKVEFLTAFGADIYFDDQQQNCSKAASNISSAHVPYGIASQAR